MLIDCTVKRILLDERRNENCRNAQSQAIELEGGANGILPVGIGHLVFLERRKGRRVNVVIRPAVLVVEDDEQALLPQIFVTAYRFINIRNQELAINHVVGRMLIVRLSLKQIKKAWHEER